MIAVQTKLPTSNSHATSKVMTIQTNEIDHKQLSQWLINVAENRCKISFTHLFKFFAPKILGIAKKKINNNDSLAQEILQETMTKVWRKAHLFNPERGAVTTWIYTVMRNVLFDSLRKIQHNQEDNLSEDIWPVVEASSAEDDNFQDHLQSEQLLKGIAKLPSAQQEVLKGYYLQEMSQEQLAHHLNLPLGTVKSRLRLALSKLKTQLGEQDD